MIIYPQKPTILAQKRSFTPNFFEFQHFFVHRPLKTSNACIEKFIYPAASSILTSKSPKPPWNLWFSGFFLHSPFEIIVSPAMTGLKSLDCFTLFAITGLKSLDCHASLAMTGLESLDCHASLAMTGLESLDCFTSLAMTEKKDQIFVFYKRKAVKDHVNS